MLPIELHAMSLCCPGAAMCGKHEPTPHDIRLTCDADGMRSLCSLLGTARHASHLTDVT